MYDNVVFRIEFLNNRIDRVTNKKRTAYQLQALFDNGCRVLRIAGGTAKNKATAFDLKLKTCVLKQKETAD